ncbi:MAG: septum formation protein Maf [Bacteroidales bacterium]|nr:MAG: septum formation protein Maf [Bacteroidales bacterium]
MLEKLNKYDIILASQSPRRQYLLQELGLKFKIARRALIKEEYPSDLHCTEIPVYLAINKAQACIDLIKSNTILIAADTIVCLNNEVLDKPDDYKEAFRILQKLSGNKHQVITGICIKSNEREVAFYSKSDVYFRNLTDPEIEYYIKHYKPFDKAGSYGIQEWIGYAGIEKIEGSYFNVMGLPTEQLYNELIKFVETEK